MERDAWNGLVTLHDLRAPAEVRQPVPEIADHARDGLGQISFPERGHGADLPEAGGDLLETLEIEIDLSRDRLEPLRRGLLRRRGFAQVRRPAEERGDGRPELVRGLLGQRGPERPLLPGHQGPESHEAEDQERQNHAEFDVGHPAELSDQRRLAVVHVAQNAGRSEPLHLDRRVPAVQLRGLLLDLFHQGRHDAGLRGLLEHRVGDRRGRDVDELPRARNSAGVREDDREIDVGDHLTKDGTQGRILGGLEGGDREESREHGAERLGLGVEA